MSRCIDLDSTFRSRDDPAMSENNYTIPVEQLESWQRHPRTVTQFPAPPATQPVNKFVAVRLASLVMPYSSDQTPTMVEFPKLYVQITNLDGAPLRMVEALDGRHSEATFVATWNRTQFADDGTTPLWVHFKCRVAQVYALDVTKPMQVRISGRNGETLPALDTGDAPNPLLQTLVTLEVTPYLRSDKYANHLLTPVPAV
jgi:hypothetical protein